MGLEKDLRSRSHYVFFEQHFGKNRPPDTVRRSFFVAYGPGSAKVRTATEETSSLAASGFVRQLVLG